MDHLAHLQVSMETPADADGVNFRSPGRKERTDSGDGEKEEFSLKTPTGRDARGTPKTESEDPQVLGTREEGGNQTPKTSACRHDPGGSWLDKATPKTLAKEVPQKSLAKEAPQKFMPKEATLETMAKEAPLKTVPQEPHPEPEAMEQHPETEAKEQHPFPEAMEQHPEPEAQEQHPEPVDKEHHQ
ncbi:hypothetical protein NDU88_002431 [Pleurodeles waltl]|uniref:Uncharacterized protein n=1 Tax=Pleurodeles waltl TaxID=8319 RepID=A0AAV7R9Y4_PLEWA|nr:hypothetical protein NDU88_002431 [Pleurodeles waltl]